MLTKVEEDKPDTEVCENIDDLSDKKIEQRSLKERWISSGNSFKDFLHFCGPGWFVTIAYLDPGNTQADINCGANSGYNLLWTFWWTTCLSIYVQVLCARLAVLGQITLAEVQRDNMPAWLRYISWVIAEFSVVITDLPEVIGFGIALNIFFGIPYYVGVLISPVTTILFLASQEIGGMRIMEAVIVLLIGMMGICIWIEWGLTGTDGKAMVEGWVYGFAKPNGADVFSIMGVIGAVVMPHNLYLHTASVMSRPVKRDVETIKKAKFWTSIEPIFPILLSFTINIGLVSIAADKIYPLTLSGSQAQMDKASNVGNTNFAEYLDFKGASVLWGLALLAAAQSSSITTTYSGQYIMDGFLRLRIPVWLRAVLTRLVAILPCVVVAATMDAEALNITINIVNATLGIMLPFALTPLAKFSTSKDFLGEHCPGMVEKVIIWLGAFLVYVTNAYGMSAAGGGLFGGYIDPEDGKQTVLSVQMAILNDALQVLFLAWQIYVIWMPIKKPMRKITCTRFVEDEHCFGIVKNHNKIQHSTSISWDENEEEPCCETA